MEEKQTPFKTATTKAKEMLFNAYKKQEDSGEQHHDHHTVNSDGDVIDIHIASNEGVDADADGVNTHSMETPHHIVQEIEELRLTISSLESERNELRDKYVRTMAEFDNFRRRTEREREQILLMGTERVFAKLVSVIDDLHTAIEVGEKSSDYQSMMDGLKMIYTKTVKLYEDHGVKPLSAEQGEPFDVDKHEALMHIPHPETPEGHVVQQIQRGYTMHDKVLRHAKVVTSAGSGE
jgi:molecular chaperone GrpE